MSTQINKSPPPLMWIAGTSIILFYIVGMAAVVGWIPSSSTSGDKIAASSPAGVKASTSKAPTHVASNAHSKATCGESGYAGYIACLVKPD